MCLDFFTRRNIFQAPGASQKSHFLVCFRVLWSLELALLVQVPLGTLTEEQAKQRWLARQEAPAWGQGPAAPQYPAPAEPEYPAPDVASRRALALAVPSHASRVQKPC